MCDKVLFKCNFSIVDTICKSEIILVYNDCSWSIYPFNKKTSLFSFYFPLTSFDTTVCPKGQVKIYLLITRARKHSII